MIEAALDRTLIQSNQHQAEVTSLVEEALPNAGLPLQFDTFVQTVSKKLHLTPGEVEESFWGLIDSGKLSLTHDFQVVLR